MCKQLGWHIVIYFDYRKTSKICSPFFESLPTTVVIDHMGRPEVAKLGPTRPVGSAS